jgi:hypothetical protein
MERPVESYIVRIYRRDNEDVKKIVGMVELVGLEEMKAFRNSRELLKILNPPQGGPDDDKGPNRNK